MKRRLAALLIITLASTGIATTGVGTPAWAADGPHYWMYTDDPAPNGGKVDFWTIGDIVQVCDNDADGYHVKLTVFDETAWKYLYSLTASGSGVCNTRRASDGGVYDLPEGHCFEFDITLYDGSTYVSGSEDWARWRNYNDATANC